MHAPGSGDEQGSDTRRLPDVLFSHGGHQGSPSVCCLDPSSGVVFDPREWPGFWPPLALAPQRRQRYGVVVDTATRPVRSRIGREYSFESLWMSVLPARSADL